MTKVELIEAISEWTNLPKYQVATTLRTMLRVMNETLKEGGRVYWRGLGYFEAKKMAKKKVFKGRMSGGHRTVRFYTTRRSPWKSMQ